MTQEQIDVIKTRYESAIELVDELHTERLAYTEYLTLRDSIYDVDVLLAEAERLQTRIEALIECVTCVYAGDKTQYPCNTCGIKEEAGI